MGTLIVLVAIFLVIALIVRSMIKDKKAGKSVICGGDCKHCGGHCSH
ncbi:MAG: FeoB-associated Cys-rich membrane protein [Velocimicrobium sp.]